MLGKVKMKKKKSVGLNRLLLLLLKCPTLSYGFKQALHQYLSQWNSILKTEINRLTDKEEFLIF